MADVTAAQALAHPTWDMGPVVTINSATLVNKGLEVIEAHLLFGIPYDRIEVVVHPQSVIHSMVTFTDGATIAQASPPDMRLPIALALAWPDRLDPVAARLRLQPPPAPGRSSRSTASAFPALDLAFAAGRGRAAPCRPCSTRPTRRRCDAFRGGHLPFHRHLGHLSRASWTRRTDLRSNPRDVADVLATEHWARRGPGRSSRSARRRTVERG